MNPIYKLKTGVIAMILLSFSITGTHALELSHAGWIPRWSPLSGEASVKRNPELFSEISPMWYKANPDGSLTSYKPENEKTIKALLVKHKIELIPTVAMFDYADLNAIFSTQENFDRHVAAILYEVEKNKYAGIDLDYESILLDDKEKFFDFIEILSKKLHENNRKLSVTVLSKWGDNIVYGLPQTRAVQDWKRISKYADIVRVMAYDYTYSGSTHPGPIGPLSWHRSILEYAIKQIPKNKLVIGVHLYAYRWNRPATDDFMQKPLEKLIKENNFNTPGSFVNTGVKRLIRENKDGILEEYEGEKFYRYQRDLEDGNREDVILVFADQESVQLRQQLATEFGIRGVAYWSLGGEEDLLDPSSVVETQTESNPSTNSGLLGKAIEILKSGGEYTLERAGQP